MRGAFPCVLALVGCVQTFDSGDVVWVSGDVHVHSSTGSNDTDGVSFPADIAAVAAERGLGFVVLTDHSNSTGSMHCEDVEDCPNLGAEFPATDEAAAASASSGVVVVVGNEISPLWAGHVGCLPPEGGFGWEGAFVDRPEGEVTGEDALDQCRSAGGYAVMNHPFAQAPWIAWDWSSAAYDAMEVWNGGWRWDAGDERALQAWECSVARGQHVTPVAASDNHRVGIEPPGDILDPPLGQPRTSVALTAGVDPTWPAIRRGLQSGQVVLHEADTFVSATHVRWTPKSEEWTVSGTALQASRVELRSIPPAGEDGCDPSDPTPRREVLWEAEVDGAFEVQTGRLDRESDDSRLRYLVLIPLAAEESGDGGFALTGLLEVPP